MSGVGAGIAFQKSITQRKEVSTLNTPLVSIVIVAYKSRDEIGNCLLSIPRALEGHSVETVVVDNSPQNGTGEIVRAQFPWVKYLAPATNVGFGRANNLGYAQANAGSEFILFLNPDTVCNEAALTHCMARLRADAGIGLISPKLVLADGSMDLACRRGIPTLWDGFCRAAGLAARFPRTALFSGYNLTHLPENGTYDVGAINGAFMFGRRDVFETVAAAAARAIAPVEDLKFKEDGTPVGGTPDEEGKLKFKVGRKSGSDGLLRRSAKPDLLAMTGGTSGPKAYSLPPTASSQSPTTSSSSAVFDESFFMYGDDLDLCIRVARAGWRIVYDGAVSITHLKGTSVAKDYGAMSSAIFDANRDVYLKHFNPRHSRLVAWNYRLAFGLWKRVARIRAALKGHRQVRPL